MKARLSPMRDHVEIEGHLWSDRFPVAALPAWIRFYRLLADRRGGAYRAIYAPTVAALDAVARELRDTP